MDDYDYSWKEYKEFLKVNKWEYIGLILFIADFIMLMFAVTYIFPK